MHAWREQAEPHASGYAPDKAAAERDARTAAGQDAEVMAAQYVQSYHRAQCAARRAARPASSETSATAVEYAFAWWYPWDDSEGHWIRHQIVKLTPTRVYLNRKHEGLLSDGTTVVIDRQAFERDGYARPTLDLWHGCADGFYAAPFDREARYRRAIPVPECLVVLGVAAPATANEVRRAYRRLAKEHHPDAGGEETAFVRIQAAYEEAIRLCN